MSHKAQQKYTLCKLSGSFLNTESASLPDQRWSRGAETRCHSPAHNRPQPHCVRLHGSFVFILPYVFRLHSFFVLRKLNTQAIIHAASRASVQQHGDGRRRCDVTEVIGGQVFVNLSVNIINIWLGGHQQGNQENRLISSSEVYRWSS